MDYYNKQLNKHTADLKPYFSVLAVFLVVLILGIVGQCDYNDKSELQLTDEQKAEVMGRQHGTSNKMPVR